MTTAHSAGPWVAEKNSWSITTISAANGDTVAVIDIYDQTQEEDQDDMEAVMAANAALLASAPDLLAALQALTRSDMQSVTEYAAANATALAAIAKATGSAS